MAKEKYPEVELLKQVKGVGDLIALAYVLPLEDPHRFPKSREVGWELTLPRFQSRRGHPLFRSGGNRTAELDRRV